jgi:hypothetical protein
MWKKRKKTKGEKENTWRDRKQTEKKKPKIGRKDEHATLKCC